VGQASTKVQGPTGSLDAWEDLWGDPPRLQWLRPALVDCNSRRARGIRHEGTDNEQPATKTKGRKSAKPQTTRQTLKANNA